MNNVTLIGNLVRDPDVREYGKGKDSGIVTRITVAVRRDQETSDFISCVAFGKTAELIDTYFSKGSKIGITGRIQTGKYEDKDGETHYTTDVIIGNIDFLTKKEDSGDYDNVDEDEELPFDDKKKSSKGSSRSRRR